MFRNAILFFAFAASPAAASHYVAEPAAAPAQPKLIVRGTMWKCGEAGCTAGKSNSRPAIVCSTLAREIGPLRSFSAAGVALSAQDLEKCNASAS